MIKRLGLWLVAMSFSVGVLVGAAGRTDLPRLWAFAAVVAGMMLIAILSMDPEVIQARLTRHKTADPVVLALARLTALATLFVGAYDAGRLRVWGGVPVAVSVGALALLAAAFGFALVAIRANRFFTPAVRIQPERGHHVVDRGPYRFVRHPGYLAVMFVAPAAALSLGSWLALIPAMASLLTFIYRTWNEDRFLMSRLEGYAEYAARTRWRLVPGVWAVALVVAAAAPLAAQDTTRAQRPAERPFVEGGQYDRPYLTRLLGRTAVGGYAEAHARYERADGVTEEAGFSARRWNLFTATQVSDFVRIGAELEFEDGTEEIKLEYAAIDFGIHPAFSLRAGMLLSPLGRFNLAHDSPRNEFTDRPLVSTDLLGVALSEPGLGAFGRFALAGDARVTYEVYAVNGFDEGLIDRSPDGTRIPLGRGNVEDNNRSPAFVGRVAWSPRVGFEVGVSGHHGAWNVFTADGARVDDRRDLSIWVLDGEATLAGVRLMGEAATARIDVPPGLVGIYAERQRGFYVQAVRPFGHGWVRTMPASHFAAALRLDVVDFDADLPGDNVRRVSAGLNFRPTQDTVLKLNWTRGTSRDRFNNPGEEAGLLFSLATYF